MDKPGFIHESRPGTLTVWAGEAGLRGQGPTQVPVVHSVAFGYPDLDSWLEVGSGAVSGHITNKLMLEFLPRMHVDVVLCNTTDHDEIERGHGDALGGVV